LSKKRVTFSVDGLNPVADAKYGCGGYADGLLGAALNVTMTFTNPVSYVGFAWGTPDPFDELDVYNGSTLLGSFLASLAKTSPHTISTSLLVQGRPSLNLC
jgi:hypothetical protein